MKRFLLTVIFLVLLTTRLYAAGSSGITDYYDIGGKKTITLSWIADAADHTVPDATINAAAQRIEGWYLYSAETNPGAVAPTDDYDIVITDADGLDIAKGLLMNRDTATTELADSINAVVRGNLTFTLTNNSVNSATGTLILVFVPN